MLQLPEEQNIGISKNKTRWVIIFSVNINKTKTITKKENEKKCSVHVKRLVNDQIRIYHKHLQNHIEEYVYYYCKCLHKIKKKEEEEEEEVRTTITVMCFFLFFFLS